VSTMKHVYIAGPYRGKTSWEVENNIRNAENAGFDVALLGAVPVIPHTMYRHFNGTLEDDFWLRATLSLLKRCDAMLLIPGWRRSEGSLAEHENFAGPQFENPMDLKEWLRSHA
jgi:hypothetical protein